jgi:molybdopterin converting factor subunit 1
VRVRLRYFASIREALGRREEALDVPAGSTVADVWELLVAARPALRQQRYRPAVNQEYVDVRTVLREEDEVVFIPPVSGGAETAQADEAAQAAQAALLCRITREPIDAQELIAAVQTAADGAVCVFYGVVREDSRERKVRYLEYDAYPEMAEKKMRQILDEVRVRWPAQRAAIVHRIGRLEVGEASVLIAVASPHRGESFEACRHVIDRVKQEVPIWKKEVFTDGEAWVEGS